jgi:hydroxypyruvate reductase
MKMSPEEFLRTAFEKALAAADPFDAVLDYLPPRPLGRTIVVGAGKAAARMAQAVEAAWGEAAEGLVIVPHGHKVDTKYIEVVEGGHPVPDQNGVDATHRILEMARSLTDLDLLLVLVSGGGSSLLTLPAADLTLGEKQILTQALLKSGARIKEINTVRRHLSGIKNGRLAAAAAPAQVITLIVSDVPGDDPAVVASGPTVPDKTTPEMALDILEKYNAPIPPKVRTFLEETTQLKLEDVPSENHIIIRAADAMEAAATFAQEEGLSYNFLGDDVEGEAKSVAMAHANLALSIPRGGRPMLILSGGELTVKVKGEGRGGRNQEYLLGLAIMLNGAKGIYALSVDTDGIDGFSPVAGALLTPGCLKLAIEKGLDPKASLKNNDSYTFFDQLGTHIITGPTLTNVNDFRAILCL